LGESSFSPTPSEQIAFLRRHFHLMVEQHGEFQSCRMYRKFAAWSGAQLGIPEDLEDRLRRFEKEARAASALNHPSLITIYDVGVHGVAPYIVMELVDGRRLRDLIGEGPLPAARVVEIGAQIAAGLAKAHEAGIVHRDLKPENVMVSNDGFVKILDFGLVKLAGGEREVSPESSTMTATQLGVIVGTPGYMSPEQASGGEVDFPSDQYALGTILYELITGKNPFRRDTIAGTMAAIIGRA
jgi:serine/threonine-protein kinase